MAFAKGPAQSAKKVFVASVDSLAGKFIAQLFYNQQDGESDIQGDPGEDPKTSSPSRYYHVIGRSGRFGCTRPSYVDEYLQTISEDILEDILLDCPVVVYDIMDGSLIEEALLAVTLLHRRMDDLKSPAVFVLVSTVMTWARTRLSDQDDPEAPFTDDDYRRRKSHPNFKQHIQAEKTVTKLGKTDLSKLRTYVICSGHLYGGGEDLLHFFFKQAWLGMEESMEVFGSGKNVLPMIHAQDLAAVLLQVVEEQPRSRYILALDDSFTTMEDIVKAISNHLGPGKIKQVNKEDALLHSEIEQSHFDMLMINLRMTPTVLREEINMTWVAETGFVENITQVIQHFRKARGLLPLRICILGPPASGKSSLASLVARHYKLHHVHIKAVIDEALDTLAKSAARVKADNDEPDEAMKAQEDQEFLETLSESRERNRGRLEDQFITRFFKQKLLSKPCQNQGFVLDGYPKTLAQARELFSPPEDPNEDEPEDDQPRFNKLTIPEFVFCIDSSDEFLQNRVMNLPESVVHDTHNAEEGFFRRLIQYRSLNTDDETVLNYFDELEIHPTMIDTSNEAASELEDMLKRVQQAVGSPRNYGPSPEELEEMHRLEQKRKLDEARAEREAREQVEKAEAQQRAQRLDEWRKSVTELKRQEQEALELKTVPLRTYLMQHVMPVLNEGLIECCRVRPEDPVDYLAEYLFRHAQSSSRTS